MSLALSAGLNVACAMVLVLISRLPISPSSSPAALPDQSASRIVWLQQPGPGGGGGGGGNRMLEPPRKVELPGRDAISVPVARPPQTQPAAVDDVRPLIASIDIPAWPLASGLDMLPGAIDAPSGPPTLSQGPGSNGGSGSGRNGGDGPDPGPGLGRGGPGGTGGGDFGTGNGATRPVPISAPRPNYTESAMRARVQGVVVVECTVRPDGSVTDVHLARSLDPIFGLDDEAMKTARQWRFRPGTRRGTPVPVVVTIELTFALR